MMYTKESEEAILGDSPDFVLDAIDNIDTKVDLLVACRRRGLRVLCSAGAGARADPTRLRFSDISELSTDNLGRKVKHRLRWDHGIEQGGPSTLLGTCPEDATPRRHSPPQASP